MIKKVLIILSWVLFTGGIFFLMGFSSAEREKMRSDHPEILIDFSGGYRFIEKEDILSLIQERCDSLKGKKVTEVETSRLEYLINAHPSIEHTEVYQEVNGQIHIEIQQRQPLIRVMNTRNESFYIDRNGFLMPLSHRQTAYVPAANGFITEGYAGYYGKKLVKGMVADTVLHYTILDDLYLIGQEIDKDPFLKGQIQQIYVNEKMEFEMIPRAGDHVIYFGEANDISEKMEKMKVFYKKAVKSGAINNYAAVNLQYKNQVVCTKKI